MLEAANAKEPDMPAREPAASGAPTWIDLLTSDTVRSRAFYTALFGWTADEPDEGFGGYITFRKDGLPVAGCMLRQADNPMPDAWSVYLATDDAAKTLEIATAHGGKIMLDALAVGDLGTMGFAIDPGGAAIGVWQHGTHKGIGVGDEPGTPGWFELQTRAYDAAVRFYRDVFGWDAQVMSDTPELRYTVQQDGEAQRAGIMDAAAFLPEGVPSHWAVYFAVADTDAAQALTAELGGSVVMPADDTPYGRIAAATDSTGAAFRLMGPNKG
jgi:predicted enzyme related to lactoylglutathione lyase